MLADHNIRLILTTSPPRPLLQILIPTKQLLCRLVQVPPVRPPPHAVAFDFTTLFFRSWRSALHAVVVARHTPPPVMDNLRPCFLQYPSPARLTFFHPQSHHCAAMVPLPSSKYPIAQVSHFLLQVPSLPRASLRDVVESVRIRFLLPFAPSSECGLFISRPLHCPDIAH
jgi:hypothetical protein